MIVLNVSSLTSLTLPASHCDHKRMRVRNNIRKNIVFKCQKMRMKIVEFAFETCQLLSSWNLLTQMHRTQPWKSKWRCLWRQWLYTRMLGMTAGPLPLQSLNNSGVCLSHRMYFVFEKVTHHDQKHPCHSSGWWIFLVLASFYQNLYF